MSPSTPTAGSPPARQGWSAGLLTGLFLVAAALLFYGIYLGFPQNHEFTALLLIGVVALIFAVACYLLESASRDPAAQRSLAWAFLAMGFATLFLTVGLGPTYNVESFGSMLLGLFVLVIVLAITIALIAWRIRGVQQTARQQVARESWRAEAPVSALNYATANSPSVPSTSPPPSTGAPPSRGP
jgi:hypothetical protein